MYLGTTQTVALYWYSDDGFSEKMTWPQAFQGGQKGEANTEGYSFKSKGLHTSCNNIGKYAIIRA